MNSCSILCSLNFQPSTILVRVFLLSPWKSLSARQLNTLGVCKLEIWQVRLGGSFLTKLEQIIFTQASWNQLQGVLKLVYYVFNYSIEKMFQVNNQKVVIAEIFFLDLTLPVYNIVHVRCSKLSFKQINSYLSIYIVRLNSAWINFLSQFMTIPCTCELIAVTVWRMKANPVGDFLL